MILGTDTVSRHVSRGFAPYIVLAAWCNLMLAVALWRLLGDLFAAGWLAGASVAIVGALHIARRVRAHITAALIKMALAW